MQRFTFLHLGLCLSCENLANITSVMNHHLSELTRIKRNSQQVYVFMAQAGP